MHRLPLPQGAPLLRWEDFLHRRRALWDECYVRTMRWIVLLAVVVAVMAIVEFAVPDGIAPNWVHYVGPVLFVSGFAAMFIVEGMHFPHMIERYGLRCPSCGAWLAGSAPPPSGLRYVPGELDRKVQGTGKCTRCGVQVLAEQER